MRCPAERHITYVRGVVMCVGGYGVLCMSLCVFERACECLSFSVRGQGRGCQADVRTRSTKRSRRRGPRHNQSLLTIHLLSALLENTLSHMRSLITHTHTERYAHTHIVGPHVHVKSGDHCQQHSKKIKWGKKEIETKTKIKLNGKNNLYHNDTSVL